MYQVKTSVPPSQPQSSKQAHQQSRSRRLWLFLPLLLLCLALFYKFYSVRAARDKSPEMIQTAARGKGQETDRKRPAAGSEEEPGQLAASCGLHFLAARELRAGERLGAQDLLLSDGRSLDILDEDERFSELYQASISQEVAERGGCPALLTDLRLLRLACLQRFCQRDYRSAEPISAAELGLAPIQPRYRSHQQLWLSLDAQNLGPEFYWNLQQAYFLRYRQKSSEPSSKAEGSAQQSQATIYLAEILAWDRSAQALCLGVSKEAAKRLSSWQESGQLLFLGSQAEGPQKPTQQGGQAEGAQKPTQRGSQAEGPQKPTGRGGQAEGTQKPTERGGQAEGAQKPTERGDQAEGAQKPTERGDQAEGAQKPTEQGGQQNAQQ